MIALDSIREYIEANGNMVEYRNTNKNLLVIENSNKIVKIFKLFRINSANVQNQVNMNRK